MDVEKGTDQIYAFSFGWIHQHGHIQETFAISTKKLVCSPICSELSIQFTYFDKIFKKPSFCIYLMYNVPHIT